MRRLTQPEAAVQLEWLADQPEDERTTGYSPAGWKAETWVLHSMYENPDLHGLGTHDDVRRRALEDGEAAPDIVGGINLDDVTTSTGTPLGFSTKPGPPWQRLTWSSYLSRFPEFGPNRTYPPCFQWFPAGSWSAAIEPPSEGSLDEDALHALIEVLAEAPSITPEPWCFAFYAALPASDFDDLHIWQVRINEIPSLLNVYGGDYEFTPTNLWSPDRSWFISTDYDLQATRISARRELVEQVEQHPTLESTTWP